MFIPGIPQCGSACRTTTREALPAGISGLARRVQWTAALAASAGSGRYAGVPCPHHRAERRHHMSLPNVSICPELSTISGSGVVASGAHWHSCLNRHLLRIVLCAALSHSPPQACYPV